MIVVIDNYDSFTYNLVQYLGTLGAEVEVHRNDAITVDAIADRQPEGLLISPGPGETTRPSGSRSASASTVAASFRTTNGSAPSVPRYWTRL